MLVIAAPCSPPICVVWYSNGPGFAWNCHPNKDPQNCWLLVVSSAGISMCTISPGTAASSVRRYRDAAAVVLTPRGRGDLIGRCPDTGLPAYFRTRDRILRARSHGISGRSHPGRVGCAGLRWPGHRLQGAWLVALWREWALVAVSGAAAAAWSRRRQTASGS